MDISTKRCVGSKLVFLMHPCRMTHDIFEVWLCYVIRNILMLVRKLEIIMRFKKIDAQGIRVGSKSVYHS